MLEWIPAPQAAGIIPTTFGTEAFQPRQKFAFCQQLLQQAATWKEISPTFQEFKHQHPSCSSVLSGKFDIWGTAVLVAPEGKLCVHQHFPPKFSRINHFCQQLGAQEFLIHARMAEKLLPVSDSFHSSVGPRVPILRVVIGITPQTRLDVRDAHSGRETFPERSSDRAEEWKSTRKQPELPVTASWISFL